MDTKMEFKARVSVGREGGHWREEVMQDHEIPSPDPSWDSHPDSQWTPEGAAGRSP